MMDIFPICFYIYSPMYMIGCWMTVHCTICVYHVLFNYPCPSIKDVTECLTQSSFVRVCLKQSI